MSSAILQSKISGKRSDTKKAAAIDHGMLRVAHPIAMTGVGETDNSRAYDALKQQVLTGAFAPGEALTLRAISNRLGFGDTPVREAVKRLISEGAFEGLPNRSARVPVYSEREINQILRLRSTLEGEAAALAAQNISLHQIEHLRNLNRAMGIAITAGDHLRYSQLGLEFHFEIYRTADNRTLATLIEALWLRMAPVAARMRVLLVNDPKTAQDISCRHHVALLTAFQHRDAEGARKAMVEDLFELFRF